MAGIRMLPDGLPKPKSVLKAPDKTKVDPKKPKSDTKPTGTPTLPTGSGSGGRGGRGGLPKSSSSTTKQTTKNTTKQSDKLKQQLLRNDVDLLLDSVTRREEALNKYLSDALESVQQNRDVAQRQYDSGIDAIQTSFDTQMGSLNAIQTGTEKALSEELSTTSKEFARMIGEINEQMAGLGVGESDALTARVAMNADRMITSNQSLRGAADSTASTNLQKGAAYSDAYAGRIELDNSLDRELADLEQKYANDTRNQQEYAYTDIAKSYKDIADKYAEAGKEMANRLDESAGQKVNQKTTTKYGKSKKKVTDKNSATYKVKTSMSDKTAKKLLAYYGRETDAATGRAQEFLKRPVGTAAVKLDANKTDWTPTNQRSELKHNMDINIEQAQTTPGKRVSGSTLKGW